MKLEGQFVQILVLIAIGVALYLNGPRILEQLEAIYESVIQRESTASGINDLLD